MNPGNPETTAKQAARTDAALVMRCQASDRAAFDDIVLRYQDRVFSYVRHLISDRQDAEDITQEVFIRAYASLGSFESRASLQTWLFRIATNLCIDYIRKRRNRDRIPVSLDKLRDEARADGYGLADVQDDPADALLENELRHRLLRAVYQLPERLRTVVVLHDIEGLPYDQVAGILRCPLGTVKSRLFHARMALRDLMLPYLRGDTDQGSSRE